MATKNISTLGMVGLIPADMSTQIIEEVTEGSVMLRLANIVPMTTPTKTFPVQLTTPGAYVVGEGQKITVDEASWKNIELVAKKIGVIVPVTKEALEDGVINVLEEVKVQIAEAFAAKLDKATMFDSTELSYVAGKSIFELADTAENKIAGSGLVFEDASNAMGLIEAGDLEPNAFVAARTLKARVRNDKTAALNYVVEDKVSGVPAQMHGEPIVYTKNFDKVKADMLVGDFNFVYVGILDQIEYQISTEGTVGDINLFEQDMVAVRATMRVGYLVVKEDAFAIVTPKVVTP